MWLLLRASTNFYRPLEHESSRAAIPPSRPYVVHDQPCVPGHDKQPATNTGVLGSSPHSSCYESARLGRVRQTAAWVKNCGAEPQLHSFVLIHVCLSSSGEGGGLATTPTPKTNPTPGSKRYKSRRYMIVGTNKLARQLMQHTLAISIAYSSIYHNGDYAYACAYVSEQGERREPVPIPGPILYQSRNNSH